MVIWYLMRRFLFGRNENVNQLSSLKIRKREEIEWELAANLSMFFRCPDLCVMKCDKKDGEEVLLVRNASIL